MVRTRSAAAGLAGFTLAAGLGITASSSEIDVDVSKLPLPSSATIDFVRDIQPILDRSCLRCHGVERPKSGFRIDHREAALRGGDNGVAIIPGASEKSPLIHYVAGLVEDMEMPPPGKAPPVSPEEIGLLRAWIDQGAPWVEQRTPTEFSVSPTVRWIEVSGDRRNFREIERMRDGITAGIEHFSLFETIDPNTRFMAEGRALADDYALKLRLERTGAGFVRFAFEQFRTYYDDTGGYYEPLEIRSFNLGRSLALDTGKASIEMGLALPHWPRVTVGYEYQYRQGDKSTLQWGPAGDDLFDDATAARNIFPGYKRIDEETHILRLDLRHEMFGWRVEDNLRFEFYELNTRRDNVVDHPFAPGPRRKERIRDDQQHHEGANTVRIEKQVYDWFFVSAGHFYSRLRGDAAFGLATLDGMNLPSAGPHYFSNEILVEQDTHVLSIGGRAGPWKDLLFSAGLQNEWTRRDGFGDVDFRFADPSVPISVADPAILHSSYDRVSLSENVGLRFTKIPFTVVSAEARFQQERISQVEQQLGGTHAFLRDTDADSDLREYRLGFNTSPWKSISWSAHVKRRERDSHYDHLRDESALGHFYPAFILWREVVTDSFETKLTLRPAPWLKTSFGYQLLAADYRTATQPIEDLSPGGKIHAGNYDAHVYSVSLSLSPFRRFHLSTTFSYSDSRTATARNNNPTLGDYKGETYSVLSSASFALNPKTDLLASCAYSTSDYDQRGQAGGLPLGLEFTRHGLQTGVTRRFRDNVIGTLRYSFFQYREPTASRTRDYTAHGIFSTLTLIWP